MFPLCLQEHNAKLLKMIEMKEEAATRLMQERLRADRSTVLIQQEQAAQAERVAAADRVAEKEADLLDSIVDQDCWLSYLSPGT